jgi:Spy/CpxP family protein refolding chaperone
MQVKLFAAAGAGVALLAVGTAVVAAQEPRRGPRADFAAIRADIGLTDQQVSEIRKLHQQERKVAIRRNADLRVARMELDELLGAATLDEAAVAAKVKAIGELQAAAFKARTESRLAIRRLVTAEQYQKMQQVRHRAVRARQARPGRRGMPGEMAPPPGPPGGGDDQGGDDEGDEDPA